MNMLFLLSLSFSILLVALCLGSLWFYGLTIYSALDYLTHTDPATPSDYQPPVSVLQAVGNRLPCDCFCQQDYSSYQLIFALASSNTSSIRQAQQLQQQYPDRDITLVVEASDSAAWDSAIAVAKFKLLVLADSQTRVAASYLQQLVQPFRYPSVGVVTPAYRCQGTGWSAALIRLSTATDLYPAALMARCFAGVHFTLGSDLAIRKSLLTRLQQDGWEGLNREGLNRTASQQMQLGHWSGSLGYRTVLSDQVVERTLEPAASRLWPTLSDQQALLHRIQVTPGQLPPGQLLSVLRYGTVFSLLLVLLGGSSLGGSSLGWTLLGLTWSGRYLMAWTVALGCFKDRAIWGYGWLIPLYDWISLGFWCGQLVQRLRQTAASEQLLPESTPALGLMALEADLPIPAPSGYPPSSP